MSQTSVIKTGILTLASLLCFAGNSLLCRAALGKHLIGPELFTTVRILSGTLALVLVTLARKNISTVLQAGDWGGAIALSVYAIFFSLAYVRIDAGIGALVAFGIVQVTVIGWNLTKNKKPVLHETLGVLTALMGLALLTVPGKNSPDPIGVLLMVVAGVAWGAYTLKGRSSRDPLASTTLNFLRSSLFSVLLGVRYLLKGDSSIQTSSQGIELAIISGVVTSALGYAIWYAAVPKLGGARAAVVQLAVPVIALTGSYAWLGETVTSRKLASVALILGGIAIALGISKNLAVGSRKARLR